MDFSGLDEGHSEGEDSPIFYYNRDRRIAHAPKIVQDYYGGKMHVGGRGLFRSLVATRGNRALFFSVVICAAAMLFMWHFGPRRDRGTVHAVPVALTAFSYMDTVYTDITFDDATAKYAEEQPVPVSAEFLFFNTDGQLVGREEIGAVYDGTRQKLATTATDYDILEVRVAFRIAGEDGTLSASVAQR